MTTYPLDKPSYFLFQGCASEVSYAFERRMVILCTYQCKAPLPQVWAGVGEGGDLHFGKLQFPTYWGSTAGKTPISPDKCPCKYLGDGWARRGIALISNNHLLHNKDYVHNTLYKATPTIVYTRHAEILQVLP